jgi:hypothetical protein
MSEPMDFNKRRYAHLKRQMEENVVVTEDGYEQLTRGQRLL